MTSLVTGASGFIGGRLVEALLRRGDRVQVFCRPTSDTSCLTDSRIRIFRGDITSDADVRNAMRGCAQVFHLAAFARNWARDGDEARRSNVDALRTVFDAAKHCRVHRVVYTSTVLTYGPSKGQPVTENTVRTAPARTIYEKSKLDGEQVVSEFVRRGLDIVTVHPTRVFGPGKLTEANSTTILMKRYLAGTWRTIPGSGDAIGNYVYVHDVVRGCIAAMEHGIAGRHYILAGANLTYGELFALLASAAGRRRMLLPVPKAVAKGFSRCELTMGRLGLGHPAITPGWVDVFYGDYMSSHGRAAREIGYVPTTMRDAIDETLGWIRETQNGEVPS